MKNKLIFLGIILALSFFIGINKVEAFGPATHLNITETAFADPSVNETVILNLVKANYDACLVGLMYADVGIFEYYTNFKAYKGLHNYNAVDEMLRIARNDRDRTFAYCFKIHLGEDGISHNYFIPASIKKTKVPNYIIHPIQELKIEGRYLDPRANRMMERHSEFDWLIEQATGRDWSGEADKLNTIMGGGGFYSQGFTPESTTTFGKLQRGFFWIISKFVSPNTGIDYYNLAVEEAKAVLRGETSSLDPSGEAALRAADQETQLWLYGITFIAMIVVLVISFKKRWIGFRRGR